MALKTDKLITGLKARCREWKNNYSENLHKKAKEQLIKITENIKNFSLRL